MPGVESWQNRGLYLGDFTLHADRPGEKEEDIPAHFLLQFLDREQFIWLIFDEARGVPDFEGDLKSESFYREPFQTHYVIIGHGIIRYGNTIIEVVGDDLVVNGISLGGESSTVIDLDNELHKGAFIRTFE